MIWGSGSTLAQVMAWCWWHQAITWTSDDLLLIQPLGTSLNEIQINCKTLNLRKCFWKWCLQNVHLVPATLCKKLFETSTNPFRKDMWTGVIHRTCWPSDEWLLSIMSVIFRYCKKIIMMIRTYFGKGRKYLHQFVGLKVEMGHLTHWSRKTHLCVGKLTIIGSDNGLSPGRRQDIIWTNAGIMLFGPFGSNFSEIVIEIDTISFKKMHLKLSCAKWRPSCLGLNVLRQMFTMNYLISLARRWLSYTWL